MKTHTNFIKCAKLSLFSSTIKWSNPYPDSETVASVWDLFFTTDHWWWSDQMSEKTEKQLTLMYMAC